MKQSDQKIISDKCNDTLKWLDKNQIAEKEEFLDQQKELEAICNPILAKLYQGGNCGPGGCPTAGRNNPGGPKIEEMD